MSVKVGIFGGSFDPPHIGHLKCVNHALGTGVRCDRVLVIPAGERQDKPRQTSFEHRFQMAIMTFAGIPRTFVGPWESPEYRKGPCYTFDTVQILKRLYPHWDFHLIIGEDNASKLDSWYRGEELQKELKGLIVVPRDKRNSTELRDAIRRGKPTPDVSTLTINYIRQHRLYK